MFMPVLYWHTGICDDSSNKGFGEKINVSTQKIAFLFALGFPVLAPVWPCSAQISEEAAGIIEQMREYHDSLPPRLANYRRTRDVVFENSNRKDIHLVSSEEYAKDGKNEMLHYSYNSLEEIGGAIVHKGSSKTLRLSDPERSLSITFKEDGVTPRWVGYALQKTRPPLAVKLCQGARMGYACYGDLEPMHSILAAAKSVSVKPEFEEVDGHPCRVVEAVADTGAYKLWLDPACGYLWRKVALHKENSDALFGTPINANPDAEDVPEMPYPMTPVTSYDFEVGNVVIEQVQGHFVITQGAETIVEVHSTGEKYTMTNETQLEKIIFNPDFAALGTFAVDIPDGTPVRHYDLPPGAKVAWRNGKPVAVAEDRGLQKLVQESPERPLPEAEPVAESAAVPASQPAAPEEEAAAGGKGGVIQIAVIAVACVLLVALVSVRRLRNR